MKLITAILLIMGIVLAISALENQSYLQQLGAFLCIIGGVISGAIALGGDE